MKLNQLISMTFFLTLFSMSLYAQEVPEYYVHLLTKAEAETTGVQIGCTCYSNATIEWRSGGTTIEGLPIDKRTEPTPLVKPNHTEVYVQPCGNVWCDYVFDKDYKLMPLLALEIYIQKNKKLPNTKSAADIEKEGGYELKKLALLQQEKIEEAYLLMLRGLC